MAAVTPIAPFTSAVAGTSYTTGAFTPAAGDLLVVEVLGRRTTANGALVGSTGLTFTRVHREDIGGGTAIYLFVANALTTNVSQTLTFTCSGDPASHFYVKVCRISGMTKTALAAVRQYKFATAGAGDPLSATMAAAVLTGNPVLVFAGASDTPTGLSEPSGFSTIEETDIAASGFAAAFAYADSGITDTIIAFGDTLSDEGGMHAIELDASATAGGRTFAACVG